MSHSDVYQRLASEVLVGLLGWSAIGDVRNASEDLVKMRDELLKAYAAGYEKAKEQAAKIAIEIGDRNLEASSRAELAGRELVKHCRMSDYETSEEIVAKIREMKSS